jgi:hypothetical protein
MHARRGLYLREETVPDPGELELRSLVRRQQSKIARQAKAILLLKRLVLEQANTLDLHSEALLLLIQQQRNVEPAAPEPAPPWFDSGPSTLRIPHSR